MWGKLHYAHFRFSTPYRVFGKQKSLNCSKTAKIQVYSISGGLKLFPQGCIYEEGKNSIEGCLARFRLNLFFSFFLLSPRLAGALVTWTSCAVMLEWCLCWWGGPLGDKQCCAGRNAACKCEWWKKAWSTSSKQTLVHCAQTCNKDLSYITCGYIMHNKLTDVLCTIH